jgi:hypothetical protein
VKCVSTQRSVRRNVGVAAALAGSTQTCDHRGLTWPSRLTLRKWVKPAMTVNACAVTSSAVFLATRCLLFSEQADAARGSAFAVLSGATTDPRWW